MNPSQPDKLLSADNGAGIIGDTQQIASALGTNQSTALPLLIGVGSRQSLNLWFDVYTVVAGSAMRVADETSDFTGNITESANISFKGPARSALSGTQVLLGQFQVKVFDGIAPANPPDSDLNADPFSNITIMTESGPESRPALAVDPTVPTRFAIAANDYAARTVRISTTQDGGPTWHVSTLSRSALNQNFDTAENPSLAFDSSGRLSIVYTLANLSDSSNAVVITESSDGISFSTPAAITYHAAADQIIDSRPVIAIRRGSGRYVAWDSLSLSTLKYSIDLVRSEEGGVFGPVTTVVSDALVSSPTLALGKNQVYLGWDEWGFNSSPPYNTGGRLMVNIFSRRAEDQFQAGA